MNSLLYCTEDFLERVKEGLVEGSDSLLSFEVSWAKDGDSIVLDIVRTDELLMKSDVVPEMAFKAILDRIYDIIW